MSIKQTPSKTKASFYRRLYVAYLIDSGIATVPAITAESGMPRRTAQDTIAALSELDIQCSFIGANKDGSYSIEHWGPIQPEWIKQHWSKIKTTLGYD